LLGMLLVGTRQAWLFEHGVLGVPAGEWLISGDDLRRFEPSHDDAGSRLRTTT
jgi:hypothetical protein